MNILIIGGNGFIGSHLINNLLIRGHKIRVFDQSPERYRKPISSVDYRISTLHNIPDLYEALLGIDVVFHLASSSVPSSSDIDTVADIENNLIPTLNILNLCVKLNITRFVYFSSGGAVYGNPITMPVAEEHPLHPISSYGIIKSTTERYIFLYQRMHDLKPLILRPSNPFGPRQGHYLAQGIISTFLRKVKANESITVFGDGNSVKDYIYIDDLIFLCTKLCFSNAIGIFNIGSGIGTSINEIIDLIKKTTGKDINYRNIEHQRYDVNNFILDTSKTQHIIGDHPLVTIEEGINKTWEWIKNEAPYS